MATVANIDFALPSGSPLPEGVSVVSGSVSFNGTGMIASGSNTVIQFDNINSANFRADIVLSGDRTDFTGIQFRRVSNNTYWRMNLKNVYTRAVLQRIVDDSIVPNAGYANSLADANRGGESTSYRLVTTGDEQQLFVGGEREAGKKGILTDENNSNLPLRIALGSDAELRSFNFLGFAVNTIPEIAPPFEFEGFTRKTTKLGQFLQNPSGFVGPMYWFTATPTASIPDWNLSDPNCSAKYPLIGYASPDHAPASEPTAGIYCWLFQPELSSFTDPDAILSDPACWVEWQLASDRPEFAHVNQKANPLFVNIGRQTETPQIVFHDGVMYMNYHEQLVNFGDMLVDSQNSRYRISTNGIDFVGDDLADFTGGTIHNFGYNPRVRGGNGHTGYLNMGENTIDSIPYAFIGRALKGGGGVETGGGTQIVVGNTPKEMYFYKEITGTTGFLDDYNLSGREEYNTNFLQLDNARKEGAYYRVLCTNAAFSFGPQVAPAYIIEVLIDDELNMISAPSYILSSSVGEFDELACRNYAETEWNGRTYGFYNTVDANGVTSWGAVRVKEVPHTWNLVQPLSNKSKPVEIISDGLTPATNVVYSETATAYKAQETVGDVRDGTYTNYTSLKLPLNGDVSTAVVSTPITLADYDYIDIDGVLIGKESDDPIDFYFGATSNVNSPVSEVAYYWPSGVPADDSQPMQIATVGTIQDSNTETINTFGNKDDWNDSELYLNNEQASTKHEIGFRIIPSLDQLIVKYGVGFREVIDITGFDYSTPVNVFIRARLTTPQAEDAAVSFSNLRVTTSSADAVAVPDAPTITTSVTDDSITISTNNVAGATGYKYFLDEQSNDTGVFTGLNSSTQYTVWARAYNALGDSETSDIQSVTTTGVTNIPPTADAGSSRTGIAAGARVDFDFTGSSDGDGSIVSYNVTQTAGTVIVVVGGTSTPTPYFIAPTADSGQTLSFELTVTDDKNATSNISTVSFGILAENVTPPNSKPTAPVISGATSAQVNTELDIVAAATDDGGAANLVYEVTVTPASISYIQDGDTVTVSTGSYVGNIELTFRAFDGELYSDPATYTIAVSNNAQSSIGRITILDVPDGLQPIKIFSEATDAKIYEGSPQFTNGVAFVTLPVAVGVSWFGRWLGTNPPQTGTGIFGVSE